MRQRRRGSRRLPLALIVAVSLALWAAFAGGAGIHAGALSTGAADRSSSVAVSADSESVHGIDAAGAVHVNTTQPLVNVTNRMGRPVTVTISLQPESTDIGDLVLGGTHADSIDVALAAGDTVTVDLAVRDDATLVGRTVHFDVNAAASGLSVAATNRTVPVEG